MFLGTPPSTFNTTAGDEIDARNNPGFLQPLTNIYDYNKDSLVSAADQIAARNNAGFMFKIDIGNPPAAPEGPDSPAGDEATSAVASALAFSPRSARPDTLTPPPATPSGLKSTRLLPQVRAPLDEQSDSASGIALWKAADVEAALELEFDEALLELLARRRD